MTRLPMSEARARFTEVLNRAEHGEIVEVTRNGRPVAAMVPLSVVARAGGSDSGFREALRRFRAEVPEAVLRGPDPFEGVRDRAPGRRVKL